MCGLYKNLFRHFLKEQANKLLDCHNYNLRLDPPPPSPEIKDEQAARRPKRIKFGGGGGGTGRVQVFHCPRKYGRLLVRELWIESVLKAENTSNLVSNKQKGQGRKNGAKLYKFNTKVFFYNKNTPGNNIIKDVLVL